jgi:predicted enzyme related to lactoylglutathione lyase
VITGLHNILYASDPDAARAFFRDVLDFPHVDAGDGWLIFALPPAELATHPAETSTVEMYLMCDDIEATVADLTAKGVEFTGPVADRGWGLLTELKVPGAGTIGLYEPKHASPL